MSSQPFEPHVVTFDEAAVLKALGINPGHVVMGTTRITTTGGPHGVLQVEAAMAIIPTAEQLDHILRTLIPESQ